MNAPERGMDLATRLRRSHTGLDALYCLDSTPVLDRQSRQESNARSYPRRIPLVLERASGIYVQDSLSFAAPAAPTLSRPRSSWRAPPAGARTCWPSRAPIME